MFKLYTTQIRCMSMCFDIALLNIEFLVTGQLHMSLKLRSAWTQHIGLHVSYEVKSEDDTYTKANKVVLRVMGANHTSS